MAKVFANGPGARGSILGRIIQKKMTLDTSLLNTKPYKVRIKSKWSNPGKSVGSSQHLSVVDVEKGAFGLPSTTVGQRTYLIMFHSFFFFFFFSSFSSASLW